MTAASGGKAALTGKEIRRIVLERSHHARVGHIGSALSVSDIVAALYGQVLRIDSPADPERDRFVLSKGHAALALYAALFLKGWIEEQDLDTYCADRTRLGVHPDRGVTGIDFSTGSLGMGLSFGVGAALAARLEKSTRRVYVLMSDAECNEGAVWESAMFAGHHALSNLVAVVDVNRQQALGYTADILDQSGLAERWRSFGWRVTRADGHDLPALVGTLREPGAAPAAPHIVLADTVFGKGVSFMEGKIEWHYQVMSDAEFQRASDEVSRQP